MNRIIAGLVLVAALVAAGCGSSSSAKPADQPPQKGVPPEGEDGKPLKTPDPG